MAHLLPAISSILCLTGLAALLAVAAIDDIRHRHISNRINLATAALALPYWLSAAPSPLVQIGYQAVLLLVVAGPLLALFALGAMGGGDVKLLAALTLWLRPDEMPTMIGVTAAAGALIGIVLLIGAGGRRHAVPSVPYGVAIGAGALIALSDRLPMLIAAIG